MLSRVALASLIAIAGAAAADPLPPGKAEVEALIAKASSFLLAQAQPSGAFVPGEKFTLGVTGLAAEALISEPAAIPAGDPRVAKAIAFVNGFRQPDGGVYNPAEGLGNYCTSIALLLWTATRSGDTAAMTAAQNYIFGLQNADPKSPSKGGIGYGSKGPGFEDLSNTSWAISALRTSGIPASDPRMQEAVKFLERCQDLSRVNKLPWAKDSGGGVYSPDESKAEGSWNREQPKAGDPPPKLVPYGSMSYALISTYVVLDVKPEDPRVAAALGWVKANYTFDKNPGVMKKNGQEGLFYYYLLMAKTYGLTGDKGFELKDGTAVDWRADLFAALSKRARIAGDQASWSNDADRWGEGLPVLVTSYVLKALKTIDKSL